MSIKRVLRVGLMALLGLCVCGPALAEKWDFSGVERIELEGVSGDVILLPGRGGGTVELKADITRGHFEPSVEEDGDTLRIREEWSGGSSSGEVEWTIYVPSGTSRIEINTASGSLTAEGIAARIDLSTASGDIELIEVDLERGSHLSTASGDYEIENMRIDDDVSFSTASGDIHLSDLEIGDDVKFSSASGDVECNGCRGYLDLSSASGDVTVKNSSMDGPGSFSSASGDVFVHLDEMPRDGLSASSASGDVVFDGNLGRSYTLILSAREDKGRIVNPYGATSKRTYREGRYTYDEETVEEGGGGPEIRLHTSSGKVVVKD